MKFKWDEERFLEGAKAYYDYSLKHSKKRLIGWIFIAILQFGIVMLLKQGTYGMFLLGSILTIYWYFLRWPIRKALLKIAFKKSPLANKDIEIEVNDKVLINNQKIDLIDLIKLENGYLLIFEKGFFYLPLTDSYKELYKEMNRLLHNKNKQ